MAIYNDKSNESGYVNQLQTKEASQHTHKPHLLEQSFLFI